MSASKTIYELKRYHHKPEYRRGDLEDDTVQDYSEVFPTRKAANEYLQKEESQAKRRSYTTRSTLVGRGDKNSELIVYTGYSWVNENSGADHEEYYHYIVKKKTL